MHGVTGHRIDSRLRIGSIADHERHRAGCIGGAFLAKAVTVADSNVSKATPARPSFSIAANRDGADAACGTFNIAGFDSRDQSACPA